MAPQEPPPPPDTPEPTRGALRGADVLGAWKFLQGGRTPLEELSLVGLTELRGLEPMEVDGPWTLSYQGSPVQRVALPRQVTWPADLKHLTLGDGSGIVAPSGLHSLTLGDDFNWPLECSVSVLPSTLRSLTFGRDFNQSLEQVALPDTLQHLTFGYAFNRSLNKVTLPRSLQTLTFGSAFNQPLRKVALPPHLVSLRVGDTFNCSIDDVCLPSELVTLSLGWRFNQPVDEVTLPETLQTLEFGHEFNGSLQRLKFPEGLKSLTFGENVRQGQECVFLPSGLQSLTFGYRFNRSMRDVTLPRHLQHLTFGAKFNCRLDLVKLPETLKTLTTGEDFNQPLERVVWPSALQQLTFGKNFNAQLQGVVFPADLRSLDANWPFIGSFFFPIALVVPFLPFFITRPSVNLAFRDALHKVLGWLTVPFYLCHQTEEHAYDLRGWRYAFVPNFNHGVGALLFDCEGPEGHLRCPLNPRITEVNVACVWAGFVVTMLVAHYLRGSYAYAGICNWGMCVVNALGGHLIPWIVMGHSPQKGAFQSLFQFSFGVWALLTCPGTVRFAGISLLNGLVFHAVVFGVGTNLVLKLKWPTEVIGTSGVLGMAAVGSTVKDVLT
eukprot:Skav223893  [mRNA]  locus=scaffold1226:773252:797771:- [translate_table: standard]